jgi:4-hydroxy-2-oxoheptanedioate aldolase
MIETKGGLERCEEIAAVPGLAGLAIGPADLARALGLHVRERFTNDAWIAAVDRVLAATKAHGIGAWHFAGDGVEAARWAGKGFSHVIIANDLNLLARASKLELDAARAPGS